MRWHEDGRTKDGLLRHPADSLMKMADISDAQPELEHRNIRDGDLYGEVFGKEKNGRVRGLGLGPAPTDVWGDRSKTHRMVEEAREAQQKAEEDKRKMEEEREEERQEIRAMRAQMADMKAQLDKLANEKHGDAHQNNHPHVPVTDKGEDNYNHNNIGVEDDASSTASHQTNTYNMDSIRIISQKKALNMYRKRETPVGKQEAGRRERHVVKQDLARYRLYSIVRKCVAEGYIILDGADVVVGGHKLGTQYVEVYIDKVIVPDEPLIRPYGTYEVMHQVIGKCIAWPKSLLKKM